MGGGHVGNWKMNNYITGLPELCAGLAQLELDYRKTILESKSDLLIPQYVPEGYTHSYYTFGALFNGDKYGIAWHGPSPEPEYFLRKTDADIVVMGEGEHTIIEVLRRIGDKRTFEDIKANIMSRPIWMPIYKLPMFQKQCMTYHCCFAEIFYQSALSLPSSVGLTQEQQFRVIDTLSTLVDE